MSLFIDELLNVNNLPLIVKRYLSDITDKYHSMSSESWKQIIVDKPTSDIHDILKGGDCNFDKPLWGLSVEEYIVLYNYYYFPLRFYCSYRLFSHIKEKGFSELFIHNKYPIFIDISCKTLASTMAFGLTFMKGVDQSAWALGRSYHKKNHSIFEGNVYPQFSYVLIDDSWQIRKYVDENLLLKYLGDEEDKYQYFEWLNISPDVISHAGVHPVLDSFYFASKMIHQTGIEYVDVFHLKEVTKILVDKYYELNSLIDCTVGHLNRVASVYENQTLIINLWNPNENQFNVSDFIKGVKHLICNNSFPICILYQNTNSRANDMWDFIKEKLPFTSVLKKREKLKGLINNDWFYEVLFLPKTRENFW